jgi:hypothetical protein
VFKINKMKLAVTTYNYPPQIMRVKELHNRPDGVQRVPVGLGSQIP